jgi:hypothetical protein
VTRSAMGELLAEAVEDGRIPAGQAPGAPAADGALLKAALRYAVLDARAGEMTDAAKAARKIAEPVFAAARDKGTTQQEILLPDGTKVGLVVIKRGATDWTVDEGMLTAVVAGNDADDFEDVLTDGAARDPRVIALVAGHLPDLVDRRIKPAVRAQYQADWEANSGTIVDRTIAERVKVAEAHHQPATGEFSYRPDTKARSLLLEALALGHITEDGDYSDPDDQPAAQS